ncbi:MAG: 23S rRNA (guanosine(2251)-2'-O)-methyltransferase RlmB [Acidobacteria bacterium]|nr:23S rRNA (guanosine(2251)-2'-O)-methyltransferase RlmB [Acidobacteriota bacterium]
MEQLIYGIHPVRECLRSGARPVSCLYIARETGSPGLKAIVHLARRQGNTIRFESRNLLDQRVGGANHQGVVAVCVARPYVEMEDLLDGLGSAPLVVVLDSVEDPRNLGAVFRCCAAAGVDGVIVTRDHAAGVTPTVSKAAAGGLEYLSIARVSNVARAIDQLKAKGLWVAGLETGQPLGCQDLDLTLATALVLGNEGTGLRRLVREKCDFLASIPTPGPIRSLNVSVAAGIVLYEAIRQRGLSRSN